MDFSLASGIAVLTRTPATLDRMLRGLPTDWITGTEGPVQHAATATLIVQ